MSKFLSCYWSKQRLFKVSIKVNCFTNDSKSKKPKHLRNFCSGTQDQISGNKLNKPIPFLDKINLKRCEAKRSILVQVQSAQSYKDLHSYCSTVGTVKNIFHYITGVEPSHFLLVEFCNEQDVHNILSASSHIEENLAVPTQSQFLWFRASSKSRKLGKLKQSKSATLNIVNGTSLYSEVEIREELRKCQDISEQMTKLYQMTKLNDIGTRLRFLTARQIENSISGMFPNASAYPFGSSVNGYGKMGCDLDLILRLDDSKLNKESRLMFHCKAALGSERTMSQRHMETVGDLIHLFLPGCVQVRRILQARVPIIKYHQQLTDVECDLSMSNMSGLYMSDFLYLMGEIDNRVRPLVFAIRKWAHEVFLTNSSPGRWISNFSLTLLVLAFLQRPLNSPPVLPPLSKLVKLAESEDQFVTEDGINCTFLRNLDKFKEKTANKESLESLLAEFFEYYSQFDFLSKAVCLNEAVAITKPEFSPMYIVNPLERGLNVSKNVSNEEVERFKVEVKTAAWNLESQETRGTNWGLLSLFENNKKIASMNFSATGRGRLMSVKSLFNEENEDATKISYKNKELKHEVNKIKKTTADNIKSLERTINRHKSQR